MTDDLRDVSHTPPHDTHNRVQNQYEQGADPVADGGQSSRRDGRDDRDEPTAADEPKSDDEEDVQTLKDVDHTPPDGEGTHHVYRRGRTWK